MDPTATKVTSLPGKDRGVLGDNPRGSDHHDTLSQNGMDHHEWDMEPPPKGMGFHPRHASQDSGLMQISREPGRGECVYSHEAPPSYLKTNVAAR